MLEVEDVHLEATDPAAHGQHCERELLGGLGLPGLPRDEPKGVAAGTDVARLDLGLAQSAPHIQTSGAELQRHPVVADRLLVGQPGNGQISGNDCKFCRMYPGVFPRRQRPVPRQLGRTRSLQVLGHLAVQRGPPARTHPQIQRLAHQVVRERTGHHHTRRGRFVEQGRDLGLGQLR